MNYIKKNYINISIVFLLLAIYVILFPIISKVLVSIIPSFGVCPYLAMTGKPCPLCGGTRYIANLPNVIHNPSYLFQPFGFMIMFVIFELFFRIFCIIRIKKKKSLEIIIVFDIIIHVIAVILFFFYEISFLLTN